MFDLPSEPPGDDPTVLDAILDPEGTAFLLARRPPAGTHFAAVEALDLAGLSEAACVDLLVGLEAEKSWLDARQQELLAVMHARAQKSIESSGDAREWLREDVACALRLAPRTAQNRIAVAAELATRLPNTLRLLTAGKITYRHVLVLTDAVAGLTDELVGVVEGRVLERAHLQTPGEFRAAVKRAVMAVDTAGAEEKHLQAVEERRVVATHVEDGMTEIWAVLPTAGAAVVMEAIDTLASVTSADDSRTLDQRRADALVGLGSAVLNDPLAPRAQGLRPHIQVTVSVGTLLGLDEHPAELDGYGPIPAAVARELAADCTGTWRRILTDPATGTLLDYGTTRYRPPPPLARHVMARDRECAFPHCHRRAPRCDIDHLRRWADGGPTDATNLAPLCPRHHAVKDEHGWAVARDSATGGYRWTRRTGHVYVKTVPSYALTAVLDSAGRDQDEAGDDQPCTGSEADQIEDDDGHPSSGTPSSSLDCCDEEVEPDPPPF